MPNRRVLLNLGIFTIACLVIAGIAFPSSRVTIQDLVVQKVQEAKGAKPGPPVKKYKPEPTYVPPPIRENFPLLATSPPPPIPKWNQPREDMYKEYHLPVAPPLLIGFTRTWPVLQQAVVSYITAGWPASQIYVIENTGVQQANARGQLSLQNPFFLNHTALKALGVNIIQTPTLLSFAQLQNFYLSLTYEHNWPYYFWSHMDVVALSFEDGGGGMTVPYNQPGYKTLYELALAALRNQRAKGGKWAMRFFAYDHLSLVNPEAYEDVGGWDTMIPYYATDCDMYERLRMKGWSIVEDRVGIITDVASAFEDLRVFYRVDGVQAKFVDPNPPPPEKNQRRDTDGVTRRDEEDPNLAKWHALRITSDNMYHHKHGNRGRNTWQLGQQGGQGEPFYYPQQGLAEALELITETGREIFRRKWGHRDCELIKDGHRVYDDAWRLEKDFK
ncbi:hypothetical protein VTJ49DRAFT_3103 [Mycothermus thermophilus]|uniref:Uncharacterized protein n=1 Tax=Humicola insolens TaxID=85995 RepID=A0ABR3V8I5_HUMIN